MFPILKNLKECLIISGILVLSEGTNVNYVAVGDTFNLTFKYSPKIDALIWKRNAVTDLYTVAVNKSTGNDCRSSAVPSPEGFQFYCEDGGGRYTLGITSNSSDMGNNFTTSKDDGPFSYIPFDNSVDPNKIITCNQPPTEITNFVLECTTACTNNAVVKLTYQSVKSGAVEKELANPVNMTSTVCNGFTMMKIFSFTYNINQNHPILGKFNSADNGFKIFAVVMFPGTPIVVNRIVTNLSYIKPIGSSSGEDCSWCIPVLVPIVVIVFVVFCGCCIYFVICKKKKKEEGEKPDNQDEATELKDPKTQQREGEIEKKQENH